MSLRTRLLLALLGLVAAGLLVAGAITYSALRDFLLARLDQQLRGATQPVAAMLASDLFAFGPDGSPGGPNLPVGTYVQLRDASGQVVNSKMMSYGDSSGLPVPVLPDPLPTSGNHSRIFTTTTSTTGSSTTATVRFRVLVASAEQPRLSGYTVVVAIPLAETQQTLTRLLGLEAIVSVIVLAALAVAAWLIIKRDLRPLEDMAVTADAIAAGDLARRVEPAEPKTEVGRLGLSLNTMLTRIEEAFAERAATEEKLRRFLADASHELRTPLTSIRGYSEVFARAKDDPEDLDLAMRRIQQESRRMGVMVEELLMLARLGEGRQPERAPVDLARVVDDAVCDARAAEPAREITLESAASAEVLGDDHQLCQIVANLLGNALQHTPETAAVRVRLAPSGSFAELEVADDGPGLAPEVAAKVFEPFYRADPSRTRETGGAGLGLAIVAAIVEAHGGAVKLQTAPGAGATFTVLLPLAALAEAARPQAEDGGAVGESPRATPMAAPSPPSTP